MVKEWKKPENLIVEDKYSLETKRAAIIDVDEHHMRPFAVAMKYKVSIATLLTWLGASRCLMNDRCAEKLRLTELRRYQQQQNRMVKPLAPPKEDLSERPKPRVLPLETIRRRIQNEHDIKEKRENEIHEKHLKARMRSQAAIRSDFRRERGTMPFPLEIENLESVDDSILEEDTFKPRIRFKYRHVMFDDQYYTYKTMFIHDEDQIEIWGQEHIVSRPNEFHNVHEFVQNPYKEDPPEVEKSLNSSEDSFSKWSESKKNKAYERLRNVDLYLSDSDEMSEKDNRSDIKTLGSSVNSSDNMVEVTVAMPKNKRKNFSDDSDKNNISDIEDVFSKSSGSINEEESVNKINEILEDETTWTAISTNMINELHSNESLPVSMEKEKYPENIPSEKDDNQLKKSTIKNKKPKAEKKPRVAKGKKPLTIDTTELTSPDIYTETKEISKSRKRKSPAPKIKITTDVDIEPKKAKRTRVVKVVEPSKMEVDMDVESIKLPPTKGRAKKGAEVTNVLEPVKDIQDNIPTKGRKTKKTTEKAAKMPTKSGRKKKTEDNLDDIEKTITNCKGRECKKNSDKNVIQPNEKNIQEDSRVELEDNINFDNDPKDEVCIAPNVDNRQSYNFEDGW